MLESVGINGVVESQDEDPIAGGFDAVLGVKKLIFGPARIGAAKKQHRCTWGFVTDLSKHTDMCAD